MYMITRDKHNYNIDLLKIVCTLSVVTLHTQRDVSLNIVYNPILYYLARFAMPCFFMINGYLILSREDFSFKYYKYKVANIIRILLSWSIVEGGYNYIFRDHTWKGFCNGLIDTLTGGHLIPVWFLFTYIAVYTVFLVGFRQVKKKITQFTLALFIICLLIDICSHINIYVYNGYFITERIPQMLRLWTWLFYPCLGYWLMTKYQKSQITSNQKLGVLLVVLSIIAVCFQYFECAVFLNRINSGFLYENIFIIVWCAIVFLSFMKIKLDNTKCEYLKVISSNTFGIFLIHMYIVDATWLSSATYTWLQTLIYELGIIIFSYILTYFLKKIPLVKRMFSY